MKAVTVSEAGATPALDDDLADPTAGPGQLLIRVLASAVNPVDGHVAGGVMAAMMAHDWPVTLGRDFAGVIEGLGDGATALAIGDRVFGMLDLAPPVQDGAWAELIVVSEDAATLIPDGVDTAVAGAVPLAAVTASLCVDALQLTGGETVLVVGGDRRSGRGRGSGPRLCRRNRTRPRAA